MKCTVCGKRLWFSFVTLPEALMPYIVFNTNIHLSSTRMCIPCFETFKSEIKKAEETKA